MLNSHRKRVLWSVLICALPLGVGCEEPAEVLAKHFEQMALIAEDNEKDCDLAGERLSAYLNENKSAIEEAAGKTGESSKAQASRIAVAAERIGKVMGPCQGNARIKTFNQTLSDVVLNSSGLKAKKP